MNIVYNVDCMEYMRRCKDNEFDLAIVDPPYGIGRDGQKGNIAKNPKHNRKYYQEKGWDKTSPDQEYFNELFRVSKNQIIWGANYFIDKFNLVSKGWVVWYKGQHGLTMSDCELAFTSYNRPCRQITINRIALRIEGAIHPTQKPVKLYKWLLQNYAKESDTIFDSHVGSGSSRIACYDLGFDFVGCEIDKDYWKAQEDRFKDHIKQGKLFFTDRVIEGR